MNNPDLKNSVQVAHDCGVKIDEMIALTDLKTDEEKLIFLVYFLW